MCSPFTIDLQSDSQLQFRIDAFSVPLESRSEFEASMHRNLRFIAKLPGFVDHMAFEKSSGATAFDIVTIAIWRSAEAIEGAGEKVSAYYSGIGFDLSAMLARLGIVASLGHYRAPAALQ
jgi:heme-degrading monooxygenase HmoA